MFLETETVGAGMIRRGSRSATAARATNVTWHDTQADYLATAYEDYLAMAGTVGELKEGPSIIIIVGTLDVPNYGNSYAYSARAAIVCGIDGGFPRAQEALERIENLLVDAPNGERIPLSQLAEIRRGEPKDMP